jgi:hypothetical protein
LTTNAPSGSASGTTQPSIDSSGSTIGSGTPPYLMRTTKR